MNAKKWWAIPLMVVGVLGAVAAISVELTSGYPIDGRMLVAIGGSLAMSPAVWAGIGGVFLWYFGAKEASATSPTSPRDVVPSKPVTPGDSPMPAEPIPPPASATSPSAAAQSSAQPRTAQGWLLGLGAVALVGGGLLAGWLLFGGTDSLGQTVASAGSTPTTVPEATTTTTATSTTTTTAAPVVLAEPTWDLAEFDGSVRLEGTMSEAWTRESVPYEQYFAYSETFTIGGTPGFRKDVEFDLEDTGDWWVLGFVNEDQVAWTVMDFMGTSRVLRHSLVPGESIGTCRATEYSEAPIVAAVESDDNGNVTRVVRAWMIPSWFGDGIWLGLDPALIDPSDVLLEPSPDAVPHCALRTTAASALDGGSSSVTQTTRATPETPPSISIGCPEDFSYPNGWTTTVTFGYEFSLGSAAEATFDIDYGDGKSYFSPDAGHAERNMFWHDYTNPGVFTADVRMTADNGLQASDTCTFTYSWESQPPEADAGSPNPGTSGGGLIGRGFDAASCTFDGIPLWGKVQIVDYLADVNIKVVDYLADLRVQPVDYLANSCGEWEFVDYLPDFTVKLVDYLGDVDVQFVDYLPGT